LFGASLLAACVMQPSSPSTTTSAAAESTPSKQSANKESARDTEVAQPAPAPKKAQVDLTPPNGSPDLRPIIGTDDAWAPTVFTGVRAGMSPEEVGKVIPGAEKVSKFGISNVPVKNVAGVDGYQLSFQDGKIYSGTVQFKRSLKSGEFYAYLVNATTNKYGDAKPDEVKKKLITWVDSRFRMAQASWFVDHFELKVNLDKD
jgi:hypothetical protein